MKRWLIILTIVFTFIGIGMVFDWDRTIRLGMSSMNNLINIYKPMSAKSILLTLLTYGTL